MRKFISGLMLGLVFATSVAFAQTYFSPLTTNDGDTGFATTMANDILLRQGGVTSYVGSIPGITAQQTLAAGGGAVNITAYYTAGASDAGGDAWTLADGSFYGQLKKVQLVTDGGGDATLTPTSLSGGTTIVFADAGDYAILMWNGSDWVALELGNDADGATAPVLS